MNKTFFGAYRNSIKYGALFQYQLVIIFKNLKLNVILERTTENRFIYIIHIFTIPNK